MRATPAINDSDAVGGIHSDSHAGAASLHRPAEHPPSEEEGETSDDIRADRVGLEPDAEFPKHPFDELTVGEEQEGAETKGKARLEDEPDKSEQDHVTDEAAQIVPGAFAGGLQCRR
ncbi:hypothetical protein IVB18_24080 [Bradyrhizobium sp. 186]|uniref:hypothetical protein n=1 Tax=Bradyrhizobium sp. 186 TaxID=2782654 RepID=UPI002001361E|nr:hypothetical protein [Bradyrhizobium sp. 186]UPK40036.1 hypothetical protein IVB18_24080 [Bradyrhizobium sp. 186]